MLTQETIEKLRRMRLGAMAEALEAQQSDPQGSELSFEERLGLLVDREWTARRDRKLARLLKEARLRFPEAAPEDIDYRASRGLDKPLLRSLFGGEWLRDGRAVLITGATGLGKTFISAPWATPPAARASGPATTACPDCWAPSSWPGPTAPTSASSAAWLAWTC